MDRDARRQDRRFAAKIGRFLKIEVPAGQHELILRYDPREVQLGLAPSRFYHAFS